MTKLSKYKRWLEFTAKEYEIKEEEIISKWKRTDYTREAQHSFYALCYKDKIDIYQLSIALGKHRSSVWQVLKQSKIRNIEIENKIWNYAKSRESTEGMESSN